MFFQGRRELLSLAAALAFTRQVAAQKNGHKSSAVVAKTELVSVVTSRVNPYHEFWCRGGEQCAAHFGLPYSVIQTEGKFRRFGFPQIQETIGRTSANVVFNIDAPNDLADLQALADLCSGKRVRFVTQNSMPPSNARPWSPKFGSPYYVAHIDYDQQLAGYKTGRYLISTLGGRGGILALTGPPTDRFAAKRLVGLIQAIAMAPRCFLLLQPANAEWEASASYDITRGLIAQAGVDRVAGIWAANDDMALGAAEAVALYGQRVPITGIDGLDAAVAAVQSGTLAATIAWSASWQGGIGLSLALGAHTGLVDPVKEPHSHRAFFAPFDLVTSDSVLDFVSDRDTRNALTDWRDYWGRSTGPIPDS